jgi:TonB family protein
MGKPSISPPRSLRPSRSDCAWTVLENNSVPDEEEPPPAQEVPYPSSEGIDKAPCNPIPESARDVALGLVLNEIAHQARAITNATGSAVLLVRGGVPVCCSSSGVTGREVASYLSQCSGPAGLSWRRGVPRLCHDVEKDSEFDVACCHRLGIRSFILVPVQNKEKDVVAVVQIFSPRPEAFGDREVLALQGLGHRIAEHIEAAERILGSNARVNGTAKSEITGKKTTGSGFVESVNPSKTMIFSDHWDLFLGILIVLLAILLGWMLGKSERTSTRLNTAPSPAPVVENPQIPVTPTDPNITNSVNVANQPAEPLAPLPDSPGFNDEADPNQQSQLAIESQKNHRKSKGHSSVSKSMSSDASSSELVVFENGKQVFPIQSPQSEHLKDVPVTGKKKQTEAESDDGTSVSVSEDVAEEHVLNRIEPDYTEYARERHLQGTVILNVHIGKDGIVQGLSGIAGDSQLTLLAAKAVRQWKFAPLVRNGAPVSFESQITLNFALP